MFVSKNHPNPPQKSNAPTDRGRRLATCERKDGELRVSLDEYNEHPYISIRLWERDKQTGEMWPSKKGVSVRLAEIGDVIAGLHHLAELIDRGEVQLPRRGQSVSPIGEKGVILNQTPPRTQPPPVTSSAQVAQRDDRPTFVDKRRQGPRTWSPPPSEVPRGIVGPGEGEFDEFQG